MFDKRDNLCQKRLVRTAGFYFLFLSLLWIPCGFIQEWMQSRLDPRLFYVLGNLVQPTIMIVVLTCVLCFQKNKSQSWQDAGLAKNIVDLNGFTLPKIEFVYTAAIAGCLAYPFLGFLADLVSKLIPTSLSTMTGADIQVIREIHPMISILTFVVVPTVVEEIVCRGFIYGVSRNRGFVAAIFVSTVCFSLLHFNVQQVLYAFVFGVLLGIMREVSGSVFPCMYMHGIINFISIVSVYVLDFEKLQTESQVVGLSVQNAVLSIVMFLMSCFLIWFTCHRSHFKFDLSVHKDCRAVSWSYIMGFLVCGGVMLLLL